MYTVKLYNVLKQIGEFTILNKYMPIVQTLRSAGEWGFRVCSSCLNRNVGLADYYFLSINY